MRIIYLSLLAFVLLPVGNLFADSFTFTWGGLPIEGEDPSYTPSGSAVFYFGSEQLTITLTDTTGVAVPFSGGVLTGLTWDISGGILDPISAIIGGSSELVGPETTVTDDDLSSEWAFRDDISLGTLGSFGISAVGDLLGVGTYGPGDRFDTDTNLFGVESPNGIDAGIVSAASPTTFGCCGLQPDHGPYVRDQMVFLFDLDGTTSYDITNVRPSFGSDGAALVPEPTSLLLMGTGLLGIGRMYRKKQKKA